MRTTDSMQALRSAGIVVRLFALTALLVTAAAWFGWPIVFAAGQDGNGWVLLSEAGHSSNEAEDGPYVDPDFPILGQLGDCEGSVGIPFGANPGWVRVSHETNPALASFVEARGQILYHNTDVGGPKKPNPFVTHTDAFFNHYSMDINAFLTLDPDYRHLLGDGNFANSFEPNERGYIEVEWERGGVPMFAFPEEGDRATVFGEHIWDCGHGDDWIGGDNEYRSEIHPPVGWVLYRRTSDANDVPGSDAKRTRDWVWYDSDDLPGSAETLPLDGGLIDTPVRATVADAFFSSFGGDVPESLNGCDTDGPEPCYQANEWRTSLTKQNYEFFVPAPPQPPADPVAGAPFMIWESEDRCAEVPHSPGNPPGDDVEDVGEAGDTAESIGAPACVIEHLVEESVDANGTRGINVTVLAADESFAASGDYIAFARRYKVSWDYAPPEAQKARKYRVTFDTLRVYNDSEPCGEDGEWVLSLRANEAWIHPVNGHGDGDTPFWSDGAVNDARCCLVDCDDFKDYAIAESVEIHVAAGDKVRVWARGFDIDTFSNDILPWVEHEAPGPGSYITALASYDGAEYEILYTVTDLTPASPTPGDLVIGDPKYGPHADTGGVATRVSKLTPIELQGSNATSLEYRYWRDGDAKPEAWSFDITTGDGLKVDLGSAASDGRYTIEYSPTKNGIVIERRTKQIELDSTPPTVTVPASFAIEATSAAGRTVDYTATAVDNLPGPVRFSCVPASGSFFLIKHVTLVTCTATDAVGNTATKTFTIEVFSPFGYIPDFVALSHQWVEIGNSVRVRTGNVGAFDQSAGVPNSPGFEVVLSADALLTGGPKVATQSARLLSNATAGQIWRVDSVQAGTGATYTDKIGYVPLFLGMPIFPAFVAGGVNQTLNGAVSLPAGSYGSLRVKSNGVVTLTSGNYYFTKIDVDSGGKLLFSAPSNVHVTGRVKIGSNSVAGPATGSGFTASDVVLWIAGVDGPPGQPTAFTSTNSATLTMNVYARNGTTTVGESNNATGAFLGLRVRIGNGATLNLDSAFDYPYP